MSDLYKVSLSFPFGEMKLKVTRNGSHRRDTCRLWHLLVSWSGDRRSGQCGSESAGLDDECSSCMDWCQARRSSQLMEASRADTYVSAHSLSSAVLYPCLAVLRLIWHTQSVPFILAVEIYADSKQFGPMLSYLYTWTAVTTLKPGSAAIIALIFG